MRTLSTRRIFAALCLLAAFWTPPAPATLADEPPNFGAAAPSEASPAPAMAPRPAVVRVAAPEDENITSYGTGTLVGVDQEHGLVVTNWHVVRDATGQVSVEFPDGFRSPATVLETDETWDLAALLIEAPKVPPVAIATAAPQRGDRLTIAGFGSGTYREATGEVVQFVSPGEDQPSEMLEVNVDARSGDSGGPILDQRGRIAGVLFGSGDGFTDGSHSGRVRWFLKRAVKNLPGLARAVGP
jgi:S1-C subfamily serine protease